MRLIDAYEAKAVIKDLRKTIAREIPGATLDTVMGLINCYIDAQPTVDAEPLVHGEWVSVDRCIYIMCSACGARFCDDHDPWPYCPKCGAEMDEKTAAG